ncbi:hypothetical protein Micbo1qcDRAFT_166268 [Microdochium bolleyi]|uniref:Uncharacterized protein n=1 Tax=Microdochium bolleyi TaxID=196109 RepID=A0A136IVD1_9PEZI|nr:hypothetical protein Micbo1qcDRAFT_166268 [Microdochium bolleyi]
MCKTHNFTEVSSSGQRRQRMEHEFCSRSRHGMLCDRNTVYNHEETHIGKLSPRLPYDHFPPTPPRSSHSRGGSDSERSSNRRSSSYYIDGDRIIDVRKGSPGRRSRRNSVVFDLEEPVMPRSPSRRHASMRHTAPPSPHLNDDLFQVSDPKQLEEMVDGRPLRSIMKGSAARRASRGSHASDEERYLHQRRIDDLWVHTKEDKDREARLKQKISRANDKINSRPAAVPDAPSSSSSRPYRRGSVAVERPDDLVARLEALEIKDQRKRDRHAEEEQQRRLRDRMSPRRSQVPQVPLEPYYAPPTRRDRVSYPDGRYDYR